MEEKVFKPTFTTFGFAIGTASGVAYSFYKKTGFWKGLGITIIGNIVVGYLGYSIDVAKYNNKK
jgi:hypothetical protein